MAITVVSGGVQPALDPLKDGDSVLSAYTAQAATLANWGTSATGETITDVVAEAFVNGSNSGIIAEEHSAFSPASLFASGEQGGWYDPSDLTTLYQDSAGTTPVTADGDPVGRMEDKSGNGNHVTQGTSARRPMYKTDGTLHWLQFDGVDDYLTGPALGLTRALYSVSGTASGAGTEHFIRDSVNDWSVIIRQGSTNVEMGMRRDSFIFESLGGTGTGTKVMSAATQAAENLFRVDGVTESSPVESGDLNTLASSFDLGWRQDDIQHLNGKIFGVVAVEGHRTLSKIEDTESYLANLAGVTI